ncbi:hypothetical protein DL240_09735 [Lujinxingia litoralis]|uniref:Uncharacterized protein n=1 Tax=Lujinxingia litoralis TaxID=2211119 RepID=A0A328C541_9DELT|nr:hypothetical protein DL240_09735 [Lujinxingia litoralis]
MAALNEEDRPRYGVVLYYRVNITRVGRVIALEPVYHTERYRDLHRCVSDRLSEVWVTAAGAQVDQFLPVTLHFSKRKIGDDTYLSRSDSWLEDQLSRIKDKEKDAEAFCQVYHVYEVVIRSRDGFLDCYDKRVGDVLPPFPYGYVDVTFRVRLDGSTSHGRAFGEEAFGEEMFQCMGEVLSEMRFDEPEGGICVINFPLAFQAVETTGVVHVEVDD